MSVMIERLEGMVNRYHEINEMMMSPEIVTDSRMLAKLGREQADLTQVVETYTEYKNSVSALEDAKALLLEDDKEIKEMAKMEIEELEPKIEEYLEKLEAWQEDRDYGYQKAQDQEKQSQWEEEMRLKWNQLWSK